MGYKTLVSLNIAIIGGGKLTEKLASALGDAGHSIFIGLTERNAALSKNFTEAVSYTSVESAAIVADVIIVNTPSGNVRDVAYLMGDVRRKVIIDLTSFNLSKFGQYINTVNALKAITGSRNIVKCYNKTGYEDLVNTDLASDDIDIFMASDNLKSKEIVKLLAKDICIGGCCDFGGEEMIGLLDEMSNCWHNQPIEQKKPVGVLVRRQAGR